MVLSLHVASSRFHRSCHGRLSRPSHSVHISLLSRNRLRSQNRVWLSTLPAASLNHHIEALEQEAKLKRLKKQVKSLKEALEIIEVAIADAETCMSELKEASKPSDPAARAQDAAKIVMESKNAQITGRIVACLGKDCKKQGSLDTFRKLGQELSTRPGMESIKLQSSKCLKECGKGPVVATKIGKQKAHVHKKIKSKNVHELLARELNFE